MIGIKRFPPVGRSDRFDDPMCSQLSAIEFGDVGVVAKDDHPRAVGDEFFYFRGDDDE